MSVPIDIKFSRKSAMSPVCLLSSGIGDVPCPPGDSVSPGDSVPGENFGAIDPAEIGGVDGSS